MLIMPRPEVSFFSAALCKWHQGTARIDSRDPAAGALLDLLKNIN
jgi:hypothetical protein